MGRADVALAYFRRYENEASHRIRCGIEENRKGNAHIRVVNKDGNPIEGVKIRYRLKNHAFRFGANLFMLDEFETPEKNAAYRKLFAELMNLATLPFYWKDQSPYKDKLATPQTVLKSIVALPQTFALPIVRKKALSPRGIALTMTISVPLGLRAPLLKNTKRLWKSDLRSWQNATDSTSPPGRSPTKPLTSPSPESF